MQTQVLFLPGAEENDLVPGLHIASLREPVLCPGVYQAQIHEGFVLRQHYFPLYHPDRTLSAL